MNLLYKPLKNIIYQFTRSGLQNHDDIEAGRKIFLVNLFSSLGFLYFFTFGMNALLNNRIIIASVVLPSSALIIGNFIYLRYSGNHYRASDVVAIIISLIYLFLLSSGGVNNTGLLWGYTVAPIIFYLHGIRIGSWIIITLTLLSCFILFYPDMPLLKADYSYVLKTRFMASFIGIAILSFLNEYSRQQSYDQLTEASLKLDKQARTDPLTGLSNRREIQEKISYENLRSMRSKISYSLLICDIDYFKKINDEYGHECGDHILVEASKTLKKTLRKQDIISRWGGEEFLILLPETNSDGAIITAEKARRSIEYMQPSYNDKPINITISIGIETSDEAYNIKDYIRRADENLYKAKRNGRNLTYGHKKAS